MLKNLSKMMTGDNLKYLRFLEKLQDDDIITDVKTIELNGVEWEALLVRKKD